MASSHLIAAIIASFFLAACLGPSRYEVVPKAEYDAMQGGGVAVAFDTPTEGEKASTFALPAFQYGFSTVTAISSGDVAPIPALSFTMNPFGGHLQAIGVQIILGTALVPGNSDTEAKAAGGVGFTYPIVNGGYLALGYALWDTDDESRDGLYLGINFGSNPAPQQ